MPRAILGAAAMLTLFAIGVSAQTHSHGAAGSDAAPADSTQGMMHEHMSQMEQRMQSMSERMRSMQAQMQSMHQMMRARGEGEMQGGMQMHGQSGLAECLASGAPAGLSATLVGPVSGLDLTPEQIVGLQELLTQTQSEAAQLLTAGQRTVLEAAGAQEVPCAPAHTMPAGAPLH